MNKTLYTHRLSKWYFVAACLACSCIAYTLRALGCASPRSLLKYSGITLHFQRSRVYTAFFLFLLTTLTGCSLFSPSNVVSPNTYQLTAFSEKRWSSTPSDKTLLVSIPIAAAPYQGDDMLYFTQDYSIASFVKNRWAAPPSDMLLPLIVRSLQNTGYFRAVITPPSPVKALARLDVRLIKLVQNFTKKPSVIEMTLNVSLIDNRSMTIMNSQRFSIEIPASADNPYGGVIAANEATRILLQNLSSWTVKQLSVCAL